MNNLAIIISAVTAFIISAGGSLGVALVATKGVALDSTVWILAGVVGLVSAAKDVRSLLKLPPVADKSDS
jgi:hypothetical protein